MPNKPVPICYLCAEPLTGSINVDHVPPKQLFAPNLRQKHNPSKLITIRVHAACNKAYGRDEEYFVQTLVPFARGSYAGNAMINKTVTEFHRGKNRPLVNKVLGEFERAPSGLILPRGKVAKRFEGERLRRIAWKIVRGLFFYHFKTALLDDWTVGVTVTAPNESPPKHFKMFMRLGGIAEHGAYPGVFAYRFHKFPEANDLHYWAMLLWDRIIITVLFHDPSCSCPECILPPSIDTPPPPG